MSAVQAGLQAAPAAPGGLFGGLLSRSLFLPLFWLCLCAPATAQAQAGISDLAREYTHSSQGEPLNDLLTDFASFHGYAAAFTPGVRGVVSGDFKNMRPRDFLFSIRSSFGIQAYTLSGAIFFFHQNERQRQVLRISSMRPSDLRRTLMRLGVLSPDLHCSTSNADQLLFFEGPPDYASSVLAAIQNIESNQLGDMEIKVFRLRHAWADDTSIESASGATKVPGLASILRAIVTGQAPPTAQVLHRGAAGGLLGTGLAAIQAAAAKPGNEQGKSEQSKEANIMADPRMNALIITDQKHRMRYYESIIAELDRPVDMVEIHAAIVDINVNYARDLGINWRWDRGGDGRWAGSGAGAGAPPSSLGAAQNAGLSIATVLNTGLNSFLSSVHALEEKGNAATLARPSVLTMDNVQASLEYTTTFYVKLEGNESVDLVDVTAGTTLKVTPRILRPTEDGPARLNMVVSIMDGGDPVQSDKSTWVSDVPPVQKVTINTQAVVNEGQSLLIGGFYYEVRSQGAAGTPGLMNIPGLGALFRNHNDGVQRMERLILISPRIITYDMLNAQTPQRVHQDFALDPESSDYELRRDFFDTRKEGGCSPAPRPTTEEGNP
jgi:type III secretion protein C